MEQATKPESPLVLVTGATGYIGGRLWRLLEDQGYRVRCLARRPEPLRQKVGPTTEVLEGDVLDRKSLDSALLGVDAAYYLVHSMGSDAFEEADRKGALHFGLAAKSAGVQRVIYIGGAGNEDESLSPHLRSRMEVGRILRESGPPTLEFRASIVIGSGSLSFEMIRSLVERLPIMITPRWVRVMAQPIAIEDLLAYLLAALELPVADYRVYEIGGSDALCYADLLTLYASERGLRRRLLLPMPVLTPGLSSLWLGLVTPLYARIGRKLIASIIHPTVVRDTAALSTFSIRPMGTREAIRRALESEDRTFAETRWSDSLASAGELRAWGGVRFGARQVYSRVLNVSAGAAATFAPIQAIGGKAGWYSWNWLWQLRAFLDLLAGGVGMRRGRPHPTLLSTGDTLDFWRVEAFEPNRRLRLMAEMKLPGRAWLEFEVSDHGPTQSSVRLTAEFDPLGLLGQAYWYAVSPLHQLVFNGLLREIAARAQSHQDR